MDFSSENQENMRATEILPPCTAENMESMEKAEKI